MEQTLFDYERTSSYIPLKIPERIDKVISQNYSELLLLKISQQKKTCSKSTRKECFRMLFQKVCDGVWSSDLYINSSEGVSDVVSF